MARCQGCLEDKKLKNKYCNKCINEVFDGIVPNKLNFDKTEFYVQRKRLAKRMSMSGVQDKISLKFEANDLIPTDVSGKYILKPIPNNSGAIHESDIVANEHLSMLISKDIFKIDTAKCAIINFSDDELAYITKRFDYTDDGSKYDQEDFASVLDVSSQKDGEDYKYSAKNYLNIAKAIKMNVPTYQLTLEELFKRIILNYLICNGDAHLKNFSLYSLPNSGDYRLTPNYDIMNTKYHINEKYGFMAMDLMDEYTDTYELLGYYSFTDFKKFAEFLNIKENRFKKIYELINNSKDKVIAKTENSFLSDQGKEYYIEQYIKRLGAVNYQLRK